MPPELEGWKPKPQKYQVPGVSQRYSELETAMEWGMNPSTFDCLNSTDKAEMMAFVWAKRTLENYHYEMIEKTAGNEAKERSRR